MLSPERPPFKTFSQAPRHSRSCSALPKSNDHLSWQDAITRIERSGSQSYFQDKINSVQRRIQSLRPPSRSSENPSRLSAPPLRHKRALSTFSSPKLESNNFYGYGVNVDELKVQIASSLPPNEKSEWQLTSAQIANSLPPDHLEPPPGYWQDYTTFSGSLPYQESNRDSRQTQAEGLGFYPDPMHVSHHSSITIITSCDSFDTPSVFELEHWVKMNESN